MVGANGAWGAQLAQTTKNPVFDVFFQYAPFLGNSSQYTLFVPLVAWFAGDDIYLATIGSLFVAFYITNAAKDILRLPRPEGCHKLETEYLEGDETWRDGVRFTFRVCERHLAAGSPPPPLANNLVLALQLHSLRACHRSIHP